MIIKRKMMLFASLTVMVAFVSGCKDDAVSPSDSGAPTLQFTAGDLYVHADTTLLVKRGFQIGFQAKGTSVLKSLAVFVSFDGAARVPISECIPCSDNIGSTIYAGDIFGTVRNQIGKEKYTVVLTDISGKSVEKSITITVTKTPQPITTFSDILYDQRTPSSSSSFRYYYTSGINKGGYVGAMSPSESDKAIIDYIYLYDESSNGYGAVICSPASDRVSLIDKSDYASQSPLKWTVRNKTKFRKTNISLTVLKAATDSKLLIDELSKNDSYSNQITNLGVGDVILILPVTSDSYPRLIGVEALNKSAYPNNRLTAYTFYEK